MHLDGLAVSDKEGKRNEAGLFIACSHLAPAADRNCMLHGCFMLPAP